MAKFTVIIKDDMDRERILIMSNIYQCHDGKGGFDLHAFGGQDAQQRFENFVKTYSPFKEKTDDGKEIEAGAQPGVHGQDRGSDSG